MKILVVVGGGVKELERENESYIKDYLTSKNYLSFNQVKIPWVVENKELNNYFPHTNVSHLVWIYKGKLVAVTEQDYVTKENIQLILDGKQNDWAVKNDFLPAVDANTPLVKQSPNRFNRFIAKTETAALFGTYQDGVYSKVGTIRDSIHHTRRDYFINRPLIDIYRSLMFKATGFSLMELNKVLLEVKDPSDYISQPDSKQYDYERRQKLYVSFEVHGLDTGQTEAQHALYMIEQLDQITGLKGRLEKRRISCLVLYRTDSLEKFKSKVTRPLTFTHSTLQAPNVRLEGAELSVFVHKLNDFYGNPPVFDATNYARRADMKLKINSWTDIPSVRKAIQVYGLDFRTEEREVDVFVLSQ